MRDISDKILSGTGRYTSRLVWDGGELSSEEIRDWTVTSSLTGSSDRLTLGATPAAQLTANVVTDAKLLDRKVRLCIGRGGEEVSVGVFTVTDAPAVDGVVTLTGYDAMYTAMERGYYSTVSGATTARAVLADAAQAAGLALVLSDGLDAPVSGVSGGYTLREVVGYMAALLGCNARIDGDGALRVQEFSDSGLTLDGDSIYSGGASLAGEDWTLGKLTCSVTTTTITTDEDGVTSRTDSTETLTSGDGATGVSMSNPWMTQSLLDGIFSRIGMTYRSGEVSALGDLRVEVGDMVTVMGETFPVMAQVLEYDGGLRMTLSAYAESESDGGGEGVSGPMTTAMERYAVELAQIRELDAQWAKITRAHINQLNADKASVDDLTAVKADIETLTADKLDAEDAAIKYAKIDFGNIGEAAVEKLFSASGIIKDLVVSEGHITGELVGVTIKGDLIEGGTVKADRLVVKGSDGLYYKLNTDGVTTEAEQTEYNSLDGSIITAKSITATKIAVDDLVAFGATIGGFHLSDKSMYSGTKASVDNTTPGIYWDSTGQLATGDSTRYLKHYKDSAGVWHLEICTDEMTINSDNFKLTKDGTVTAKAGNIGGWELMQDTVDGINRRYLFGGYKSDNKLHGVRLLPQSSTDDWDGAVEFLNGTDDSKITIEAARKDTADGFNYLSISGAPVVIPNLQIPSGGNIYMPSGKSVIDEAVDAVQVGGRNYIRNSLYGAESSAYGFAERRVYLVAGDTYTLSFRGYVVSGAGSICVYIYNNDWTWSKYAENKSTEGANKSVTFVAPATGTYNIATYAYPSEPGGANPTVYLSWYKLETGNQATDWTADPDDTAAYVTAQGESGRWHYRIWSDGMKECWAYYNITTDVTQGWGNVYCSASLSELDLPYPVSFSTIYTQNVSLYPHNSGAWLIVPGGGNISLTSTGRHQIARGTALAGGTYGVAYYVMGY